VWTILHTKNERNKKRENKTVGEIIVTKEEKKEKEKKE